MQFEAGAGGDIIVDNETLENPEINDRLDTVEGNSQDLSAALKLASLEGNLGEKYDFAFSRMPDSAEYYLVDRNTLDYVDDPMSFQDLDHLSEAILKLTDATRELQVIQEGGNFAIVEESLVGGHTHNEQILKTGKDSLVSTGDALRDKKRLDELMKFVNGLHGYEVTY